MTQWTSFTALHHIRHLSPPGPSATPQKKRAAIMLNNLLSHDLRRASRLSMSLTKATPLLTLHPS